MIFLLNIIRVSSLDLENFENLQHYGKVSFSDQPMNVMIDTGSSLTWVASIDCYSSGCSKHKKFNPYISETFKFLHMSFELEYGSGRIRGQLGKETLTIDKYTVKNVLMGIVTTEIGYVFDRLPFAGIIALGPKQDPSDFLSSIITQHNVSIASLSLSSNPQEKGTLYFTTLSPVKMIKITSEYYWEIPLEKLTLGEVDLCDGSLFCQGVFDTGTSIISFPSEVFKKILNKHRLKHNCENAFEYPSLIIKAIDKEFEINPQEFIAYEDGICELAFMHLDVPEPFGPFFVLGGTFLRQVTLFLDFLHNEVGLMKKPGVFVKNKLIKI